MVSPSDVLKLIKHSASESDVFYMVGSTAVTIKILAQDYRISWRTWINVMNTCQATTQSLEVHSVGPLIVVRQDEFDYVGALCTSH